MTDKFIPLIKWQKWMDPFGMENEDAKWVDYDNEIVDIHKLQNRYLSSLNNNEEDDTYSDYSEEKVVDEPPHDNKPVKVIASPMGLIPYNEHTASSKIFNFWVGHTNFTITKNIVDIIEQSDGVEILDVFTRYRFRIAIGKCFDDACTMTMINNNIINLFNNQQNDDQK